MPAPSDRRLPPGACDAHTHVFGPEARFPLAFPPEFPLPLAPVERHTQMWAETGLERGIFVQPAHYGFDHAALLDALRRTPAARGVALADQSVSDAELDILDEAGVRALRFTEVRNPNGSARPGSVGVDQLLAVAPRMAERNWHAQIWAPAARLDELLPDLDRLPVPIVIDHLGMLNPGEGVTAPSFRRLLDRVRDGCLWIKLSVCRVSARNDYDDIRPFHDALVAANPGRLLWGSDWPFIRMGAQAPDVGTLLDLFTSWVDAPEIREAILSRNPAELFNLD